MLVISQAQSILNMQLSMNIKLTGKHQDAIHHCGLNAGYVTMDTGLVQHIQLCILIVTHSLIYTIIKLRMVQSELSNVEFSPGLLIFIIGPPPRIMTGSYDILTPHPTRKSHPLPPRNDQPPRINDLLSISY